MTQYEVYNFLKKNKGKWFNTNNLMKALGKSRCSINNSCHKLKKLIDRRQCFVINSKGFKSLLCEFKLNEKKK